MSQVLMMVNYRLVEPKGESVVWMPDISTVKGRIKASRTLAHRMGYPILSILDGEKANEFPVARKDKVIGYLMPLERWS